MESGVQPTWQFISISGCLSVSKKDTVPRLKACECMGDWLENSCLLSYNNLFIVAAGLFLIVNKPLSFVEPLLILYRIHLAIV